MENDILVCACHNVDHNAIVTHDTEYKLVYVNVRLEDAQSFSDRLKTAFKYVFKIKRYKSDYTEFILDSNDIPKLKRIITTLNGLKESENIQDSSSADTPGAE